MPTDIDGGFAGCAKDMITEIADMYSRTPVLFMGLTPPEPSPTQPIYDVNAAITSAIVSEFSTIYTPVQTQKWTSNMFQGIEFDTKSKFESSAVVATAWDTLTLPFRMTHGAHSIGSMAKTLVRRPGSNMAAMDLAIPLPTQPERFRKGKNGQLANLSVDTSSMEDADVAFSDHVVMRGLEIGKDREEKIKEYMAPCRYRSSYLWEEPMRVPIPYPQYFKSDGLREGAKQVVLSGIDGDRRLVDLAEGERQMSRKAEGLQEMELLPVLSRLHCGSSMRHHLNTMASGFDEALRFGAVRANFTSTGFEADELEEVKERLLTMAEDYDQ